VHLDNIGPKIVGLPLKTTGAIGLKAKPQRHNDRAQGLWFTTRFYLEILCRAQRAAARGVVIPTGEIIYGRGGEIPLVATSRVTNAVAVAYTARVVWILGGSVENL